jgi:hypothetical protein
VVAREQRSSPSLSLSSIDMSLVLCPKLREPAQELTCKKHII